MNRITTWFSSAFVMGLSFLGMSTVLHGLDTTEMVTIAILAKDKAHDLPLYLQCIESQTWPKKQTNLYIRTNNNNDNTADMLRTWVKKVRKHYAHVHFDGADIAPTKGRDHVQARVRQESVEWAHNKKSHYFVVDCDNFIQPDTLTTMMETGLDVVAPFICDKGARANFHAVVDQDGNVCTSAMNNMLFTRAVEALIPVAMVHSTYLLRYNVLHLVDYNYDDSGRPGYMIFNDGLRKIGVPRYLDTRNVYGRMSFAKDSVQLRSEPWLQEFNA